MDPEDDKTNEDKIKICVNRIATNAQSIQPMLNSISTTVEAQQLRKEIQNLMQTHQKLDASKTNELTSFINKATALTESVNAVITPRPSVSVSTQIALSNISLAATQIR